ncbi:metal-dependent hydrolase [Nocardia cyriacigeorgica]|uniref:Metal-dependent hydrolase n=1 Tax=Nocardia cyriacigeorgica TaxID=135487 RepID=A0A6P1DDF2_9NOCA|nr:metal-dependent hydrolase [Nocardia cyriacigeorgica]NEW39861.1 metal-dependent hydrolase [Nocardia cyriacigeorgica]NEW47184.1 metal-dependent hydrolase [Nocardia cyriacigeorgica]NEW51346.1 metal-dependent hydrolase [Nocardia cyriacigeorgica]NEW55435.1 metal-dependent hydrolase [Nocardia cyriacigeorgica]
MTNLQPRKMDFGFDDADVPFLWNPQNPAWSSMSNAVSFLAVGFEKMIVKLIMQLKPVFTDQEVAEEATAFMRQEGHHSTAHRQHVKALIKQYPGLQNTLDAVIGEFDLLTEATSHNYRLAYTADLEATFTPVFKLMLDNEATLFRPGDDRVASLFIWHFVEEVEHRSSALILFNSVVGDELYRMRMAPSIFAHVMKVIRIACAGFNQHVPLADRKVDSLSMFARHRAKQKVLTAFAPYLTKGPMPRAFDGLSRRQQLTALAGVVRSQMPKHDPTHENLPELAARWFERYDAGYDCTRWYTADQDRPMVSVVN